MSARANTTGDATPPIEPPTPIDPDPGTPQTPPNPTPAPDVPLREPPTPIDESEGLWANGSRRSDVRSR